MPDDLTSKHGAHRALKIDVAKYQAMIDDPGLSEDQKREFIEALWTIVIAFVDLGFELHDTDLACGKLSHPDDPTFGSEPDVVVLETFLASKFESASAAVDAKNTKESVHEDKTKT
ncbi:hypothetical protein [uncultured Roseobacter sp.]|uniref:hypothetical protein n=1 Tax=uncultured Roseobacter sp. TaxID=114847 RepID=UPI0026352BA7|nr:hypothetical protein [uncultured Roseobacter sp.]